MLPNTVEGNKRVRMNLVSEIITSTQQLDSMNEELKEVKNKCEHIKASITAERDNAAKIQEKLDQLTQEELQYERQYSMLKEDTEKLQHTVNNLNSSLIQMTSIIPLRSSAPMATAAAAAPVPAIRQGEEKKKYPYPCSTIRILRRSGDNLSALETRANLCIDALLTKGNMMGASVHPAKNDANKKPIKYSMKHMWGELLTGDQWNDLQTYVLNCVQTLSLSYVKRESGLHYNGFLYHEKPTNGGVCWCANDICAKKVGDDKIRFNYLHLSDVIREAARRYMASKGVQLPSLAEVMNGTPN